MSDHGESLGEHGEKTHGFFVYNATLHVACIVKVPGAAPRVVADEVSLVDVMPTVLQALEIPIPSSVQGRSLLSLVEGRTTENASNLYAESYPPCCTLAGICCAASSRAGGNTLRPRVRNSTTPARTRRNSRTSSPLTAPKRRK